MQFKCFLCGVCCKKFRVIISIDEGKYLANKLEMDWQCFLNTFLDNYYVATDRYLIRQVNGNCIFLKQINSWQAICRIHEYKPPACKNWIASVTNQECISGLRQSWNLEINYDGELTGTELAMKRFNVFLNAIT